MRREKSERSEMVSQLLFGEVYEVLEEEDKWLNICLLHDHCCGWIDRKTYKEVSEEFAEKYRASLRENPNKPNQDDTQPLPL